MSTYETSQQEPDAPTADLPPTKDLAVAETGAGFLVYEIKREYRKHLGCETEIARRLIGFADVTDWDVIADTVLGRGHGHGEVLHLPEFNANEFRSRRESANEDMPRLRRANHRSDP